MAKKNGLRFDPAGTGLAAGLLFAVIHVMLVAVVASGHWQAFIDWWAEIHFISVPATALPFDFAAAVTVIAAAFAIGAIAGWLFAAAWNYKMDFLRSLK